MLRSLALTALLVGLAGCGSDASDATAQPADTPAEAAETAPPTSPASTPTPMPDLPDLSPADVSPDEPVSAVTLRDAVFGLIGQTVTVQGPATSAFSPRGPAIRITSDSADPDAPFVECVFPADAEGSLPSGDVVVRGTVGPPNLAGQEKLTMSDCATVDASANAMTVAALADAITGWVGTEVAIVGRYNGQVTSHLADGPLTVLRVQAAGTEGLTTQVATCAIAAGTEAPELDRDDRDHVFRGTISDTQRWGSEELTLTDCAVVPG